MRNSLKEIKNPTISPEESIDAKILAFFTKAERASIDISNARNALSIASVDETLRRKDLKRLFEESDAESKKINIESFASDVSRLVENFELLLNTKAIIVKMAENYIRNAYGKEASESLIEVLENEYDLTKDANKDERTNNNFALGARTPQA